VVYYTYISLEGGKNMATKKAKSSVKKPVAKTIKKVKTVKKPVAKKPISKTLLAKTKEIFLTCNKKPIKSSSVASIFVTEFIGTFLFVALFFTAIVATASGGLFTPLFAAIALVGIVLLTGAHTNPVITIGQWITRKMCATYTITRIVAQALAATAGWLVLTAYINSIATEASMGAGPQLLQAAGFTGTAAGKEWYVFFAEMLGAAILALGFVAALRAGKKLTTAAFSYGFALFIALTIAYSLTVYFLSAQGTTLTFLNPALAFVANGISWNVWPIAIYIGAPIIGSVIGFVIYNFLEKQDTEGRCGICGYSDCDCI
jgi:glycerol uptake facilitator-like aquaporin